MDELDFNAPIIEAPQRKTGTVEYDAPNGDRWRVERGLDLIADFDLQGEDALQKFHRALSTQEAAWSIVCRIYGNAPLYGAEDPDEFRAWSIAELAEKRGVEPSEIDGYLEGAKTYWRRAQLETKSSENIRARPAPDEDEADQLLRENGFGDIENKDERKYVATRCLELKAWLEDDRLRSATRSMIQQEITLFFILDPTIHEQRALIAEKLGKKQSAEKENSQLMSLLKERRDAQSALDDGMKVLGLSDAAGGALRKKMQFVDCLSTLVKAIQEYESENDRSLIDGIFTAAEVELLTTPTALRPVQYRPDLILSINEAKKHLWEADWSQTPLGRRASRKLAAGFAQGLAEVRSQDGEIALEAAEEAAEAEAEQATENPAGPIETPGNLPGAAALPMRASKREAAAMFTS